MSATWDEIRARSESTVLGGMKVHCGNCWMAWQAGELPCRKHATPEESAAIDKALSKAVMSLADHPFVQALRRRRDA